MKKSAYIVIGITLASGIYLGSLNRPVDPATEKQSGPNSKRVSESTPHLPDAEKSAHVPTVAEQMALEKLMDGTLAPFVPEGRHFVDMDDLDQKLIVERRVENRKDGTIVRAFIFKSGAKYAYHQLEEMLQYDPDRGMFAVATQSQIVADHILVKLYEGINESELEEMNQRLGTETLMPLGFANKFIVQLPELNLDAIKHYSQLFAAEKDRVERVHCNLVLHSTRTPNDTNWSSQWDKSKIKCPEAWDGQTGSQNVIVAIIDSGIDLDHPDLVANLWHNPGEAGALANNGVDDDGNDKIDDWAGWDFGRGDNDPDDNGDMDYDGTFSQGGHGTHCAGIIGAVGNNNRQVAGVCWNVTLMAVKGFTYVPAVDDMRIYSTDAELSMVYATDNGAKITSNSYGGYSSFWGSLQDGINYQKSHGVLFVAAAGNDSLNNDSTPHWPANATMDNVISVGSSTDGDGRSPFSNYGATTVDLFAPGSAIWSTVPGGGLADYSGTSMACPQVAGAAALLYSQKPSLSYLECKNTLFDNVDPVAAFSGKCVTGGRLNVKKALDVVSDGDYDDDGIPNDWEELYFGSPTGADPTAMVANGINTLLEAYFAGISPVSPSARFEIDAIRDAALPGQHILEWNSASGRVYTVYWTPNLKHTIFKPVFTNYTGSITDTVHNANSVGFYRIEAGIALEE